MVWVSPERYEVVESTVTELPRKAVMWKGAVGLQLSWLVPKHCQDACAPFV